MAPLAAGPHAGCLWVEPIYRRRGYEEALPEIWLRAEVAEALMRVARRLLEGKNVGLLVWDGWRPLSLQQRLWHEYRGQLARTTGLSGEALDARVQDFVTPPQGGKSPPAHSTGGAVDLTLCSSQGEALEMGGEFDELTGRSHPGFYERDDLSPAEAAYRDRRRLLERAMREEDFRRLPTEWWHFEYGTPNWARWTNEPLRFDVLPAAGQE
jgi:D-alanyl-D-alanine dipeptidase